MRPVRAILIDPFAKTVSEVTHDADDYKDIYRLIGANTFDARGIGMYAGRRHCIYVDDEGIYKADQAYFALGTEKHWAGKALITGVSDEGVTIAAVPPVELIAVRFYAVQPVFKTITQTSEPAEIFGKPGVSIVQTAHFDPEGVEEKQ